MIKQHEPAHIRDYRKEIEVLFDQCVFSYMVDELRKFPDLEEGGKYIGYLFEPGDPRLEKWGVNRRAQAIVITDFLPSGPNATRSAVELRPDGDFQEMLFRQAEQVDHAIEHVGTWHSHHCNGLEELSRGDVEGYFRTVNKDCYRLDYFVASLVKYIPQDDPTRFDWIDHFLFVRGQINYYLATSRVRVVDWPTIFGAQTAHSPEPPRIAEALSYDNSVKERKRISYQIWYKTKEGKAILAEDKRFFHEQFGSNVVASRKNEQISLAGRMGYKAISVTYPRSLGDARISVLVQQHGQSILQLDSDLSHRKICYCAALAAARLL